jgi:dipeptidyl aminopeptidase/acylaminoacyl peptidase
MKLRGERRRDGQQWMLDWMVKTTGRVQNFALDAREVPPEAKSYRMIPRVFEKHARHEEQLAQAAEAHGHLESARELYFQAAESYRGGQHAIFEDDNPEKIYLHAKLLECFEKVMQYAPHPIERVEIPFEGTYLQGVLHLLPGQPKAPTVLFCPGMDMTKEAFINPIYHPFVERGLNCLHLDGPGQGTSNIRKIRVTVDNYDRAGRAAIDFLVQRPEVDPARIAVIGFSMGAAATIQAAAKTPHIAAVVADSSYATFVDAAKYSFSLVTRAPHFPMAPLAIAWARWLVHVDAHELRPVDVVGRIAPRPLLITHGADDEIVPVRHAYTLFKAAEEPKDLWIVPGAHHVGARDTDPEAYFERVEAFLRDALEVPSLQAAATAP